VGLGEYTETGCGFMGCCCTGHYKYASLYYVAETGGSTYSITQIFSYEQVYLTS